MTLDQFLNIIVGCVITFGLAFTGALTEGPFSLFSIIREWLKRKSNRKWVTIGVECPICLSCWFGIPVSLCLGGGFAMWLCSIGFTSVITSLSPDSKD